jgi:hypothetical protein
VFHDLRVVGGSLGAQVGVGGACYRAVDPKGRATMLADLDLLLTVVFCTTDDLLPCCKKNAKRTLTDD